MSLAAKFVAVTFPRKGCRPKVRVGQIWQGVAGNRMVILEVNDAEGIALLVPLGEPGWSVECEQISEFLTLEIDP